LTAPKVIHRSTIVDPADMSALLRAIEDYDGLPLTKAALRLAPVVFVRPGELRRAEWGEFDLEHAEWRIPAAKNENAPIAPCASVEAGACHYS
jgi:integrase